MPSIDPDVLQRMQTYVIAMLRNEQRELHEGFEIHVAFDPSSIESLSKMQGIRQLAFLDEVPLWSHHSLDPRTARIRIHARAINEDCQGTATLTLKPYPGIVTTRDSMRRGQVVHEGDLQYQPYSGNAGSLPVDVVADPLDIIGQEVTGLVRGGAALSLSAFAPPRVIRRGDLLEVAVGGGGVRVTTGAKAMADGAMGELIEIETLSPKRRLLAKVVDSSLVEILTQPTQVRAIPPKPNAVVGR
jgi:flagella basal body P-ring formation protein FlgA